MYIFSPFCGVIFLKNCALSCFLSILISWSIWPIAVSNDFGKYYVIFLFVSSCHVVRLFFSTAHISVDIFRLPNALCRYFITSSVFPSGITELVCDVGMLVCLLVCEFCALGVVIGILHNIVFESLYPSAIYFMSLVTVTLSCLNVTSQPASHSFATDIRLFPNNMGNLCAFLAVLSIFSMPNSNSAVACILVPSGCVDFNPVLVCISNLHGMFIHKQCVVVPL